MSSQDLLFQLHIPKTGGTSLFSVLAAGVHPRRWHVAVSEEQLRERTTGFALLAGHFDWDVLSLFPIRPKVVTVLRDPIDMVLSVYSYLREYADKGIFNATSQKGADEASSRPIDALLLDPSSHLRGVAGPMTLYLAGRREAEAGNGLAAALRNLDSCAWVGTTATLARDVTLLPAMLGLKPVSEVPHHLRSADQPLREDIGKAAMRVLEEITRDDRILYDHARGIAEKQREMYG